MTLEGTPEHWAKWNCYKWNRHLLAHYFARDARGPGVVSAILVAPEELARAVGENSAAGGTVKNALCSAVLASHKTDVIEAATNYPGFPNRPLSEPRFFAHLLLTCLAASDDPDLGESELRKRIRSICKYKISEKSFGHLPNLWQALADWLKANSGRYKTLTLPTGGYKLIGYSHRLAFPHFRDVEKLCKSLKEEGIFTSRPKSRVLAAIGKHRNAFSERFRNEYARAQKEEDNDNLPLWVAVEAALAKYESELSLDTSLSITLFLDTDHDDDWCLRVLGNQEFELEGMRCERLESFEGEWQWEFLATDEGRDLQADVLLARSGQVVLAKVERLARQGLLLFDERGYLIDKNAEVDEAEIAIIRNELHTTLLQVFKSKRSKTYTLSSGWKVVKGLELRPLSEEERHAPLFEESSYFGKAQHRGNRAPLRGGVKVEDGKYLGIPRCLPAVIAPAARAVSLIGPTRTIDFFPGGDRWQDRENRQSPQLEGRYKLKVKALAGPVTEYPIEFCDASIDTRYKPGPADWWREGANGIASEAAFLGGTTVSSMDWTVYCSRVQYLSNNVGESNFSVLDAAWCVLAFGKREHWKFWQGEGRPIEPSHKSPDKRANREWRDWLTGATPNSSESEAARRRIRPIIDSKLLPTNSSSGTAIGIATASKAVAPDDRVDTILRVVAARANQKTGLSWQEWTRLLEDTFEVDDRLVPHLTRAWNEIGAIDIAINPRWSGRSIFAKSPALLVYEVDEQVEASFIGLLASNVLDSYAKQANVKGLPCERVKSISAWMPEGLRVRAPDVALLQATFPELALEWLHWPTANTSARFDLNSPPPDRYDAARTASWSSQQGGIPGVEIKRHSRRSSRGPNSKRAAPTYWSANFRGRVIWSFDRNFLFAAAAQLADAQFVTCCNEGVEARHAYLPLPLARIAHSISRIRGGPIGLAGNSRYVYPTGKSAASETIQRAQNVVAECLELKSIVSNSLIDLGVENA